MPSAKDNLKKEKNASEKKVTWSKWIKTQSAYAYSIGHSGVSFLYSYSRLIGWFFVTTGIVTLLPLALEVRNHHNAPILPFPLYLS